MGPVHVLVVLQLSMSSRTFEPPTVREQALAVQATDDVLPADVRRDPSKHEEVLVFWTGVTDGFVDGSPRVRHHYFDGVVEGSGGIWLSPWGEGRFCLLDVPAEEARDFDAERPLFVRAYGYPVVTDDGLCLRRAEIFVGDLGYSTTVLAYGPGGEDDFSAEDARRRGATRSHPEERLLTRFGYRVLASIHGGKSNLDEEGRGGWSASLEVDLRLDLRKELALLVGPHSMRGFGSPDSIQIAALLRLHVFGVGPAFGPLVHLPLDDGQVWFGGRYMPTVGDALGSWGKAPAIGGALDVAFTRDGDRRALLQLTIGLDGNFGRVSR